MAQENKGGEAPMVSDAELVMGIERHLRAVMNHVETLHRGGLQYAERCFALEKENAELKALVRDAGSKPRKG